MNDQQEQKTESFADRVLMRVQSMAKSWIVVAVIGVLTAVGAIWIISRVMRLFGW